MQSSSSKHELGFASAFQDRAIILIILVTGFHLLLRDFLSLPEISLPDTAWLTRQWQLTLCAQARSPSRN